MGSSQKKATNWWPIRVINASWLWERMPGVLRTDEPAFAAVHSSTNCLWRKYYTRHHEAKCETNQSKDEAVLGMLTAGIMQCRQIERIVRESQLRDSRGTFSPCASRSKSRWVQAAQIG